MPNSQGSPRKLRKLLALAAPTLLLIFAGCFDRAQQNISSINHISPPPGGNIGADTLPGHFVIEKVESGRLVEVVDSEGLRAASNIVIRTELEPDGVNYELATDPVTENEYLHILHPVGSPSFNQLLEEAQTGLLTLQAHGPTESPPFSMAPRNAVIRIQFSDAIDPSTATDLTVKVALGNAQFPVSFSVDGAILVIDPTISSDQASQLGVDPNPWGFPASPNSTWWNLLIEIPTTVEIPFGQTEVLRCEHGVRLEAGQDDPVTLSAGGAPIVVRAIRTGNHSDPYKGFQKDISRPSLITSQDIDLQQVIPQGNTFNIYFIANNPACHGLSVRPGDILEVGSDTVGLVTGIISQGSSPTEPHQVTVSVLRGQLSSNSTGPGRWTTRYSSSNSHLQACFLSFTPPPTTMPALGVDPFSSITVEFDEPVSRDISSNSFALIPFGSAPTTQGSRFASFQEHQSETAGEYIDRQQCYDVIRNGAATWGEFGGRLYFGPIENSAWSVTLTPAGGLSEPNPSRQDDLRFALALRDGSAGIHDLAGNSVTFDGFVAGSPVTSTTETLFTVTGGGGANAILKNKYFSLRGRGADEDGDGYAEYKGQFTVHPGKISGREPQRFSRAADPSNEFIGSQGPPAVYPTDPLNPAGAVVETVIRPSDFGFGYLNPSEFNIDIEAMAWSPLGGVIYDEDYADVSLTFAHANNIPDEVLDPFSGLPALPFSGLWTSTGDPSNQIRGFDWNILGFPEYGEVEVFRSQYILRQVNVFSSEISGNAFLQWPDFNQNFTWRDTTLDPSNTGGRAESIGSPPTRYQASRGMSGPIWGPEEVPSIGLSLLMRFRCYPQSQSWGINRFSVTQMCATSSLPAFRIFSSGGRDGAGNWQVVVPDSSPYGGTDAQGGYNTDGTSTPAFDSYHYWTQADFAVQTSRVITHWFPFYAPLDAGWVVNATTEPFEQPPGTSILVEYRGCQTVTHPTDPQDPSPMMDAYEPFDAYGDFIPGSPGSVGVPGAWTNDPSDLEGMGYGFFQIRFTFTGNPDSGICSSFDTYGLVYKIED